jgi:hypothetical protein
MAPTFCRLRLILSLLAMVLACGVTRSTAQALPIEINQNHAPAGVLRDGVLAVQLEIGNGEWHPEADDGIALTVYAFGEVGRPLQNPGPLIRVPQGTVIQASLHNSLRTSERTWLRFGIFSPIRARRSYAPLAAQPRRFCLDFFHRPIHIAQAAVSAWVLDFTCAEARVNLSFNTIRNFRSPASLNVPPEIGAVVAEAIAHWNRIFALFYADADL